MKIKNSLKNLFRFKFQPTKDTAIALILGFFVIAISLGLLFFSGSTTIDKIGIFVLRDLVMIFSLGFAFPLYYVLITRKGNLSEFGITRQKWLISLLVGVVLAVLLLFQFMSEDGKVGQEVLIKSEAVIPVFYVFIAGIFEVVFFYSFLRQRFENAFGIIPAIILASLFYSFHHAGFQPEFAKLIFVGIMYASVFRITKNVLIIYPFFWGIGATWDVFVNFGVMKQLQGTWTLFKATTVLIFMIIFIGYLKWKLKKKD